MSTIWPWLRRRFQKEAAKAKACGQEIIKFVQGTARTWSRGMVESSEKHNYQGGSYFYLLKNTHTKKWHKYYHCSQVQFLNVWQEMIHHWENCLFLPPFLSSCILPPTTLFFLPPSFNKCLPSAWHWTIPRPCKDQEVQVLILEKLTVQYGETEQKVRRSPLS